MTIKWVQVDPLVMNGEPFCYGSRLTVRQLLELRSNGFDLTRLIKDHPELKRLGIAAAYTYAADHRDRYADFFEADGSLAGPGYAEAEAAGLPAQYRLPGIVIKATAPPLIRVCGLSRPASAPIVRLERQRRRAVIARDFVREMPASRDSTDGASTARLEHRNRPGTDPGSSALARFRARTGPVVAIAAARHPDACAMPRRHRPIPTARAAPFDPSAGRPSSRSSTRCAPSSTPRSG